MSWPASPSAAAARRTASRQAALTGCSPSSSNTATAVGAPTAGSSGASTARASSRSSTQRAIGPTLPIRRGPGPLTMGW